MVQSFIEYVGSHLLDKHLPPNVKQKIGVDLNPDELRKLEIVPACIKELKKQIPELKKDPSYVEQVVAPAIEYVVRTNVFSGKLPSQDQMKKDLRNLVQWETLSIDRKKFLDEIVDKFYGLYRGELAKHQSPGEEFIASGVGEVLEVSEEILSHVKAISNPGDTFISPKFEKPLPAGYVSRPALMEKIKSQLRSSQGGQTAALTTTIKGSGGFGKTTLAQAFCLDQEVKEDYPDGIYYTEIGRNADQINILQNMAEALTGVRPGQDNPYQLTTLLSRIIGNRHLLIVLDNVWDADILETISHISPNCHKLITTRLFDIAKEYSSAESPVEVDELDPQDAADILIGLLPDSKSLLEDKNDPARQPFIELGKTLGLWAQMVAIAGNWLKDRVMNWNKTPEQAIRLFEKELEDYGYTAFERDDEEQREKAIRICLEVSLQTLGDNRMRALELCIFPQASHIPFNTLDQLWQATSEDSKIRGSQIRENMQRYALFREYDMTSNTVRLHDVIRAAFEEILMQDIKEKAKEEGNTPKKAEEHIQSIHMKLVMSWGDLTNLPDAYAWQNVIWHLEQAGAKEKAGSLLRDFQFISRKADATDISTLLADYPDVPDDQDLWLIRAALLRSRDILVEKSQIPAQLMGRLWLHKDDYELIRNLIEAASQHLEQLNNARWIPGSSCLEPAGGDCKQLFKGHEEDIHDAFEIKRDVYVSRSKNELILWTEKGPKRLGIREEEVAGSIYLNENHFLSWSSDGRSYVWESNGTLLKTLHGNNHSIDSAIRLDENSFLTWSRNGELLSWTHNGELIRQFEGIDDRQVQNVDVLESGKIVALIDNAYLHVWSPDGNSLTKLPDDLPNFYNEQTVQIGVSRDKETYRIKLPVEWSDDEYDWDDEEDAPRISINLVTPLLNDQVAVWTDDYNLRIWKLDGEETNFSPNLTDQIEGIAPMGNDHVIWWSPSKLCVWDITGSKEKTGRHQSIKNTSSIGEGRFISWGGKDVMVWNVEEIESEIKSTTIQRYQTCNVDGLIPIDDRGLLTWWSTSNDQALKAECAGLWYAETPDTYESPRKLDGHRDPIQGARVLSNGDFITWSADKTLRIWAKTQNVTIKEPRLFRKKVTGILQTNNHTMLIWSHDQREIKQMTLSNQGWIESRYEQRQHDDYILGVVLLQNGKTLSWSRDGIIIQWNQQNQPVSHAKHPDKLSGVIQGINGEILSWSEDGEVRITHESTEPVRFRIMCVTEDMLDDLSEDLETQIRENGIRDEDDDLIYWNFHGELQNDKRSKKLTNGQFIQLRNGKYIYWHVKDKFIVIWDGQDVLHKVAGIAKGINNVVQLSDDTLLVISEEYSISWQPGEDDQRLAANDQWTKHDAGIVGATQQLGDKIIFWYNNGAIKRFEVDSSDPTFNLKHEKLVVGVDVLPTGNLFSWSTDQTIRLWDTDGQLITTYYMDGEPTTTPVILADGTLAVGDSLGYVHLLRPNRALANRL